MHHRKLVGRLAALALASALTVPLPSVAQDAAPSGTGVCTGSIGVPYALTLSAPDGSVAAGATTTLRGTVAADVYFDSFQVSVSAQGPVELLGPASFSLGSAAPGQEITFEVPVRYTANGRAVVQVQAVADEASAGPNGMRTEGFYTIIEPDRTLSGMGSFLNLEIDAVESDYNAGVLTMDEARGRLETVTQIPAEFDNRSPAQSPAPPLPPVETLVPGALSTDEVPLQAQPVSPTGNITVQGTVSWQDENGLVHPCYGMNVEVRDDELIGSDLVAETITGADGTYFFVVNNDDGIGQGNRDIFVRFRTANGAVSIENQGILHAPYEADSPVHDEVPDGTTITENFTAANTGTGPAAGLLTGATWVANYTALRNGNSFLSHIRLEWPGDTGSANYNGSRINLRPGDRWDWDVMFHEYSHYVQDTFNFENNPGGPHNIGDCIAQVHSSKSEGVRLAWGEGWPTFWGTSAQVVQSLSTLNVPRVGDVSYTDTGESNFTYSLETQDSNGRGEDNEIAVQRMLWDVLDSNSDGRDNVSRSDQSIFDALKFTNVTTLSGGWNLLRAGLSNQDDLAYGGIASDHLVGPTLNSPANGSIISASSANFSWNGRVGCPSSYTGDGYNLIFYNANTLAKVLTVPVGTTSASLTNGQIQTLLASGHQMLWAVEGSNSQSPATGPYLGENFAVTVNTPPVADAGPDQPNVECASHTTTAVQLDGTGSSDPDGDPLTYTWTASGIVFDNNHSATPTGQFPEGTTTVTLTVSDGLEEDTDTVDITVVDTTPPSVTCPGDITQECTGGCGVPANADSLVAWFAEFSASDVCDDNLTIVNDAPACFPLGTTVVTWTATDDANNQAQCSASVTVEDTTPPEIAVELNRDCLWPPNHKMSPISADVTVTDVCDPNPSFVLYDITSSEPDDGKGDGHTTGDIQEADYGTEDVDFLLRSERRGGGDGRIYTIIYRAMDGSGNAAYDTVTVTVPHDQGGGAICATGFAADGASFASGAASYVLVVPSTSDLRAGDILPLSADLGNHVGVVAPSNHALADVTGDGLDDLVLLYDAPAVGDLYAASTGLSTGFDGSTDRIGEKSDRGYVVGLHFRTADGGNYLVGNILSLGEPVTLSAFLPWGGGGGQLLDPGAADEEPGRDRQEDPGRPMLVLPSGGPVLVEVYNVLGQKVSTLINADLPAGAHPLAWDGRDATGRRVSSGMYFYRIQAPQRNEVRKIFLVR